MVDNSGTSWGRAALGEAVERARDQGLNKQLDKLWDLKSELWADIAIVVRLSLGPKILFANGSMECEWPESDHNGEGEFDVSKCRADMQRTVL